MVTEDEARWSTPRKVSEGFPWRVVVGVMLLLGLLGISRQAPGQRLERPRFVTQGALPIQAIRLNRSFERAKDDGFNFFGFVLGGALGAAAGGFLGYHLDRQLGLSKGDDPGITGFLLGVAIGGTTGAIIGGDMGDK